MKKPFKILACLLGWLALTVAGHAQNLCVDTVTTNYQCLYSGTTNTLGVLSYTNLDVCIGETIIPPTATDTTFLNGSYQEYDEHSCTNYVNSYSTNDLTYVDGWMSNGVYTATNVYFVPPIPTSLDTATNFQCLAEVDGIDLQGHCTNIIGIVLGTVTITCTSAPPAISSQPVSQTVLAGNNVTFSVVAAGCPTLAYQWYFNLTNLLGGATNSSLDLTNVQLTNAGSYSVTVSDPSGSTNSIFTMLTVLPNTYIELSGSLTNYTFRRDTTYYISGAVSLYGTNILEGSAVIKFTNSVNPAANPPVGAGIALVGSSAVINCQTGLFCPAIFTAKDDDSVGATIRGSTGVPTNYYGGVALTFNYGQTGRAANLHDIRIVCLAGGIAFNSGTGHLVSDAQIVNCCDAFLTYSNDCTLRNVLVGSASNVFLNASGTIHGENVTFAQSANFSGNSPATVWLTNSLVVAVTNSVSYSGLDNHTLTNAAEVFETVGAGHYYLATASDYRLAGTTNINAALQNDLKTRTTYAPLIITNVFLSGVTLEPQAQRDEGDSSFDLGYHYAPIDFIVRQCPITNGVLYVSNGTVVACYNEVGFLITGNSSIQSIGTPLAPNWFVRYSSVQEAPTALGNNGASSGVVVEANQGANGLFEFSDFACPAGGGLHIYNTTLASYGSLLVQNCEFWSGQNLLAGNSNSVIRLENNLFNRSALIANTATPQSVLSLSNNLVWGTANVSLNQPTNSIWTVFDNDFDSCTISGVALTNGYNAYLNCTGRFSPTNAHDVVQANSLSYQSSFLGDYYQPTNSVLSNVGSKTNAAIVGLYHFTTTTNQIKESNSSLDIGYHYVALDTNGYPVDSNTNGIADYLEDVNGNGWGDTGESPWSLVFVSEPQSQEIVRGGSFTLNGGVVGISPLTYQWQQNGTNISGATTSSYLKTNAQPSDVGNYHVIVSNIGGTATSTDADITMVLAPIITVQPTDQTALQGTNVTFSVTVAGVMPLSFQWREGTNLISGQTNAFLTLTNLQITDAGSYSVQVTNSYGATVSSNALLTLIVPPAITAQPISQTVVQGSNVTFRVVVNTNSTPPLSYQWYFNRTNLLSGATDNRYINVNAQPHDAGSYTVVITNTAGAVTSLVATISVIIPPTILAQPTNQTVIQNNATSFSVSATATTPMSYQWYFNTTNALSAATNTTLSIGSCQVSNIGSYSVVISNIAGVVTSSPATLNVEIAPSLTGPQSTNVIEGSSVTLSVSASGTAPLSYQWRKNGTNYPGAIASSLTIPFVTESDQASYSVVVSNTVGTDTSADSILTVTIPPTITAQPIDEVVPQGSVATFSVSGSGTTPLTYQWYTNGVALADSPKYAGATSSTLVISNVTASDVVVYSVAISNGGGSITSSGAGLELVGVDRIIVDGSSPEIRDATSIALGSSITLRVMPISTPPGSGFPSGYPVWSASDSTLAVPSAGATIATITPTNAGQYTIWATCGTSNAFVLTVNSTNDANYDGIIDSLEDPNNPPQIQLGSWQFDTLDLVGLQGQKPLIATNVAVVGGWSILAAQIDSRSNGPTVLSYRDSETNSLVSNINLHRGTVHFLFNPDWTSSSAGGRGPQNEGRLIEVGDKNASSGCWGLYLDSNGTNLTFCAQTNGGALTTNFSSAISWTNGDWYEVDFTYSSTNTSLYVNGGLVTNNSEGVSAWPGSTVRANGFRIGGGVDSNGNGTNCAQGTFDDVQTYNYPWSSPAVDNYYRHHPQPIATNTCLLAPMALYVSAATTLTNGQVTTTTNNAGNGNFVWLNWYQSSTFPLKEALTNWAYSQQFTNANDSTDTTLSTGDWIWADTGWQASVESSLDWLIANATNGFGVVLWNNATGTGSNTKYEADRYARIQLLSYSGSAKSITYRYLGLTSCDSYSNLPPVTQIVSPLDNQIYSVPSNDVAFVPITATGYDPEGHFKSIEFYWGTNDSNCTNDLGAGYFTNTLNDATNLYAFDWTSAPHGSNSIKTIAFDELLQTATSQVSHVVINWEPTVSIESITNIWDENSSAFVTNLTSSVWDDGLPYGQTNLSWSIVSSNGPVTMDSPTSGSTVITLSTNGTYQFELTVDDGVSSASNLCYVKILRRPFVDIVSPSSNATVFASALLPITAGTFGYDTSVTGVQFYYAFNGLTNLLGDGSPAGDSGITNYYSFGWTNAPLGTNILLIAVATDANNLTRTSSIPVTIISPNPGVQIVSPIDHHFVAHTVTNIDAIATQAVSNSVITNVQFFVSNGTTNLFLGSVTNTTNGDYQVKWFASKSGTYIFTALAIDDRNSNALSAPVTNYVRGVPVVTIIAPTNGSKYYLTALSTNLTITATAVADSANVTNIDFYHDGTFITNALVDAASNNVTVPWFPVTNGTYHIQAFATDDGGAVGSSTLTIVTVFPPNQCPSVYAGPDQQVNLSTNAVQLAGVVVDDGLPNNYLSVTWSNLSTNFATFSDPSNPSTTVTFTNAGTNVLQLSASDGQCTNTSTVTILVKSCYTPPNVDAGPGRMLVLPALANTNPVQTIKLAAITGGFSTAKGVDYFIASNAVVVSDQYAASNLIVVTTNGDKYPLPSLMNQGADEMYIATVRDSLGGFGIGEMFCGNNQVGQIMRIRPDGSVIGTNSFLYNDQNGDVQTNYYWASVTMTNGNGGTIPGNYFRGGVWVDRTGVWGGDLIVVSEDGYVFRVNSNAVPTLVTQLTGGDTYEGVTTIPNDVQRYGPWAGRIVVGNDNAYYPVFAIDTNGVAVPYHFNFGAEDIRVIPANENFYGVNEGMETLVGAAASEFQGMAGDILIVSESYAGELHRVHWNGTSFESYVIASGATLAQGSFSWEQANFAPAGLLGVPPANYVTLQGSVINYCTNSTITWIKESGPGPVTFDDPTSPVTKARFTVPGTYWVRLIANDGQFVSSSATNVVVVRNQPPVVSAGPDRVMTNSVVTLMGSVSDDGLPYGVTNVVWSFIAGPVEPTFADSNVVTTTVSFPQPGTYVLRLTVDDGQVTNSAEVTLTTASTNLTVTPKYGWPTPVGTTYQVTARAIDQYSNALAGVRINVSTSGANSASDGVTTDSNGYATYSYTGASPGRDSITATINDASGQEIAQTTVIKDWSATMNCGDTKNPMSSSCWSLDWPTNNFHYSDYFTYSATAGSQFILNYTSYFSNPALVLRDPSNHIIAVSTGGSMAFNPSTSGNYLIEMTDVVPNEYPDYQLTVSCSTNQNPIPSPQIEVSLNGTNIPNGSTIEFPTALIGVSNTISLIVSNAGTAELDIFASTNTGDFTLTNDISNVQIAIGSITNLGVTFNASTNETSIGVLWLQHNAINPNDPNDPNTSYTENYVVYLVGSAYPPGTNPAVRLTSPTTNDSFYAPATIPISAIATAGSTNISYVMFELLTSNGPVSLGTVSNSFATDNSYGLNWANVSDGTYTLTAVAVDADGRTASAPSVTVQVAPSQGNQPPFASPDTPRIFAGSKNNILTPLDNDSDPDGDPIRIVSVTAPQLSNATVTIVGNGAALSYNAPPTLPFGIDQFTYQITDGRGGYSRANVAVSIYPPAKPDVVMVAPVYSGNTYTTNAGAIVPLTAYVNPYQAVSKVDFFLGESLIGTVTNGSQGYYTLTNWTAVYSACGCGINAQATDKFGQIGSAQPIYVVVTNADITNSSGELNLALSYAASDWSTNYFDTADLTNITVIRDGIVDLYGQVFHALGSNVTWQLGIFNLDGTPVKNLTPPPYDAVGGCTHAVGSGSLDSVMVQNCDLTTIPNGVYYIILNATSGQIHNETKARIQLESTLKIGQFSFSQQDIVIPVKGIPLTVTRTYNSLNFDRGDFGYSWSMALMDMDVVLDETRDDTYGYADDDEGKSAIFSQRTGGFRDVTLTLPTGKRVTFYYNPQTDELGDISQVQFITPPGLPAGIKLTVQGNPQFQGDYAYGQYGWVGYGGLEDDLNTPEEAGDFPGFTLSMPDGSSYIINREDIGTYQTDDGYYVHAYGKPYLAEIDQRSGDRIIITKDYIEHDAAGVQPRRIVFQRNDKGLIESISDPSGLNSDLSPTGYPALKYQYDYNDNLVRVLRLTDRNQGIYTTNSFTYTNIQFPHYITGINNGRGIGIAKNYYDDTGKLIATEDAFGRRTQINHDVDGHREVVVDRLGHTNVYVFDNAGNITDFTNAIGGVIHRSYDDKNNVLSFTDPTTNTTYYGYDEAGNRTNVVDALGHTNQYTFNFNQIVTAIDPVGNIRSNSYDASGLLTAKTYYDAHGVIVKQVSSSYQDGKLVETRDASNNVTATITYDSFGNLTNIVSGTGVVHNYGYDANGYQTTTSYSGVAADGSPVAITTTSERDAQGRIIRAVDGYGNETKTIYNELGKPDQIIDQYHHTNFFIYDAAGNLIQSIHGDGTETRTVYDVNGQPILDTDRNRRTATLTQYDENGAPTNKVRLLDATVSIIDDPVNPGQKTSVIGSLGTVLSSRAKEYFPNGWVKSQTDSAGHKTTYTYWPNGKMQSVTDPLTNTTYYSYDDSGRRTNILDALQHNTGFVYDGVGNLLQTRYQDSSTKSSVFDLTGREITKVDQMGFATSLNYTSDAQLQKVILPFDSETNQTNSPAWQYSYDAYGHLAVVTDPKGHNATNLYNPFGDEISRQLPMGQVETNMYNAKGQLWQAVDFNGQTTEFVYDDFGRIKAKFLFAAGASSPSNAVCYRYDFVGQVTNIIERYGDDATTNPCDGYSALVAPYSAPRVAGRWLNFNPLIIPGEVYGAFVFGIFLLLVPQEVKRKIKAGVVLAWRHSAHKPLVRRPRRSRFYLPMPGWRGVAVVMITILLLNDYQAGFVTALNGQCFTPQNLSTSTTRLTYISYDYDGHVTQINSPEGVINYQYDSVTGKRIETCTKYSDITYTYDELGRLKVVRVLKRNGISLGTPETTTYEYDAVGNRKSLTLPNGTLTTYEYDSLNHLTNLTETVGTTNLADYVYLVDKTGRRTNGWEMILSGNGTYVTNSLIWQYDALSRLTNELCTSSVGAGNYTNTYQYDLVGNRLNKIRTGASAESVNYSYNDNDQLVREDSDVRGGTTYAYDSNGSLTNQTSASGITSFTYDVANRLSSVTTNAVTTHYLYNDGGIRVQSSAGGSTLNYLVDPNNDTGYAQVLEEAYSGASSPARTYVFGNDLIEQASATATSYVLQDGHGSTRQLTDTSGAVTSTYTFDAYGVTLGTSSPIPETSRLYCGEEYDSTLNMYNLRARYYNPSNGRFNSMDSADGYALDPQSFHKYNYTHGDPVNWKDPSGNEESMVELMAVVAVVAVVASGIGLAIGAAAKGPIGALEGAVAGAMFAVGWAIAEVTEEWDVGLEQAIFSAAIIICVDLIYNSYVDKENDYTEIAFDGFQAFCWGFLQGEVTEALSEDNAKLEILYSTLFAIAKAGVDYVEEAVMADKPDEIKEAREKLAREVGFAIAAGCLELIVDKLTGMFGKKQGRIFLLWPSWLKRELQLKTVSIPKDAWKSAIKYLNKFDESIEETFKKIAEEMSKTGDPTPGATGHGD